MTTLMNTPGASGQNSAAALAQQQPADQSLPMEGQVFELEVRYDDPMNIVAEVGIDPGGWKYLGPELSGSETCRVRLISLGHVADLAAAKAAARDLNPRYRLLDGRAREAFKAKFPRHNMQGHVVFGGSEWVGLDGDSRVAALFDSAGTFWVPGFSKSKAVFTRGCLWAVVETAEEAVASDEGRVDRSEEEADAS